MNTFSVKINNVDYSRKVYFAPKWANILDERLDEGYIFMKGVTVDNFAPLSFVEVTFINHPSAKVYATKPAKQGVTQELQDDGSLKQTEVKQYFVATDNAEEYPVGSNKYTHSLYLIEVTKYAERLIGDSLYFGNTKAKTTYAELPAMGENARPGNYPGEWQNPYQSTLYEQANLNSDVYVYMPEYIRTHEPIDPATSASLTAAIADQSVKIEATDGNTTVQLQVHYDADFAVVDLSELVGNVSLIYSFDYTEDDETINYGLVKYTLGLYATHYPLKPWTVTEAITRCCELIEPLRAWKVDGAINKVDIPRFRLDGVNYNEDSPLLGYLGKRLPNTSGSQAEKYDKVFIPTMALTKCTFREQLQQIAKIAHAEPRLTYDYTNNEFTIYLDEYGGRDKWTTNKKYVEKSTKETIDDFCTTLDSQANNFVNTLDDDEAALIDPYDGGSRSLRVDTVSARITDGEAFAQTVLPIYQVLKVECSVKTNAENNPYSGFYPITDYIFEKAAYDNLSSFEGAYPYVKGYALYYTQGTPNIYGLWFKPENPVSVAWGEKYAIVNIMNAVMKADGKTMLEDNYPEILFRITYRPAFGQRVRQSKTLVGQTKSLLVYNQGANFIETRYFGNNLKGVVARLGNVEKTVTYKFAFLSEIPRAGQIFGDSKYYISAVDCEYTPNFIKATLALSKDFNRLSEYVGINKENRLFEVSEKQAQDRDSIYAETLLVTYKTSGSDTDTLFTKADGLTQIGYIFHHSGSDTAARATMATVWGEDKNGDRIHNYTVNLPVVSSAFGNSMSFTFKFADNYSAGQKSVATNNGYFGDNVPIGDYYGRMYYLGFRLKNKPAAGDTVTAFSLPQQNADAYTGAFVTTDDGLTPTPILYRKNGEEVPSFTYQLDIKTDEENIIIGSAFARICPLVTGVMPPNLILYVLPDEVPLFKERLTAEEVQLLISRNVTKSFVNSGSSSKYLKLLTSTAPHAGKAWAIVTPSNKVTKTYEDDDGFEITVEEERGLEIVLARNIDIAINSTIKLPNIALKKEIT